jgi:hypothetical protein
MSTYVNLPVTCSVCGTESRQRILTSTNSFGAPDLDLRPAGMQRATMDRWVQECPHCGYVAFRLNKPAPVTGEWLQGELYTGCDGRKFASNLAERFFRLYLIAGEAGNHRDAYLAALYGAWACDDSEDTENAAFCRRAAIDELDEHIMADGEKESVMVQRADLMRRAGLFDELLRQYATIRLSEAYLNKLLDFELEKAAQQDDRCYTLEDVPL